MGLKSFFKEHFSRENLASLNLGKDLKTMGSQVSEENKKIDSGKTEQVPLLSREKGLETGGSGRETIQKAVEKGASLLGRVEKYFQEPQAPNVESDTRVGEEKGRIYNWISSRIKAAGEKTGYYINETQDALALKWAKNIGVENLNEFVGIDTLENQGIFKNLNRNDRAVAGSLVTGSRIFTSVKGLRHKIEAASHLYELQEQAQAKQKTRLEELKYQKEDETVLAKLYSDAKEARNGKAFTYEDYKYMYSRAKEKFGMAVALASQAEFNEDPKAAKTKIALEIENWKQQKEEPERHNLKRKINELHLKYEQNIFNIDASYLNALVEEALRLGVPFSAKVEVGMDKSDRYDKPLFQPLDKPLVEENEEVLV